MNETRTYKDGEPCSHPGCLNHVSHPCEGCGRVEGRGTVVTIHKGSAVGRSECFIDEMDYLNLEDTAELMKKLSDHKGSVNLVYDYEVEGTETGRLTNDTPEYQIYPYQEKMLNELLRGDSRYISFFPRHCGRASMDMAVAEARVLAQMDKEKADMGKLNRMAAFFTSKPLEMPELKEYLGEVAQPKNKPWYGRFDKKRY